MPMRPVCIPPEGEMRLQASTAPRAGSPHARPEDRMTHGGDTARTSDPAPAPGAQLRVLETPEEPGAERRTSRVGDHLREWRSVYLAFAISRLLVAGVGWGVELALRITGADPANWRPFAFAETYPHYADVALHGYTLENAVNFPLMPGLMAGGAAIGIPMWLTAFLATNLAFLVGLVGMAMLGERFVGGDAARRGALYLALAPFAYWFSVTSTEGLLLGLVAGSALLALRGTPASWLGAGVLAAVAALSRPPGAFLGIVLLGILVAQLRSGSIARRSVAAALAAGAMIPAAVIGFMAFLDAKTGDPLAFMHAQDEFNRHVTADGPIRAIGSALELTVVQHSIGQAIELVATFGAAALLVWFGATAAGRRWEVRGWTLFGAASLLLPLATGVLWQMPRFALLIPPVFWMLGALGSRHVWLHRTVLVLFPVALMVKVATAVVGVHG
ncbi:MAG: hypothetical protein JWM86_135 [Thermoleophilia bacterium]|nr:hypothetical protein [Thermoleophilia bacterium]